MNETLDELQNVADQLDTLTTLGDELNGNLSAIGSRIQAACSGGSSGVCGDVADTSKYTTQANFSAVSVDLLLTLLICNYVKAYRVKTVIGAIAHGFVSIVMDVHAFL